MSPILGMLGGLGPLRKAGVVYLGLNWRSACSNAAGDIMYATCGLLFTEVWKSTDYGVTWLPMFYVPLLASYQIKCNAAGDIVVFNTANTSPKFYVSNNYGVSFTLNYTFTGPQWGPISISDSGQYIVSSPGGFWGYKPIISSNYGVTFATISAHPTFNQQGLSIWVSPDGSRMISAFQHSYVISYSISTNYGASWSAITSGYNAPITGTSNGMTIAKSYSVGSPSAAWQLSTDGGNTYTTKTTTVPFGSSYYPFGTILDQNNTNKITVFGYNSGSNYKFANIMSTDGGATWSAIVTQPGSTPNQERLGFSRDATYLVFAANINAVSNDGGAIRVSSDSGATWTRRL